MVILIDTNVILDYLISRQPFVDAAENIFKLCFQQKHTGYVATHSITDIFYVLRKDFPSAERKKMLLKMCDFIEIVGAQKSQVIDALANEDFSDFEDCLQLQCAKMIDAKYIVTRNIKDFVKSPIQAISPEDFLEKTGNNRAHT
jgi:predicted nucleic-acid-binding protein